MNMQSSKLTPHELLDLHEILTFKNTCALKATAAQSMVTDQELKGLLNQDITATRRQMQDIQSVLGSPSALH